MWLQNNAVHKIVEFAYKYCLNQHPNEDFDLAKDTYVQRLKLNFLANNHHYLTADEFDEVIELIKQQLIKDYQSTNLFYIFFEFSSQLLTYHAGEIRIDVNYLFDYVSMSNKVDSQNFLAAYTARKSLNPNDVNHPLKTSNTRIEHILVKGLYENHMHLNGSGSTCELSMLTILQEGLLNAITLSKYIRNSEVNKNESAYQHLSSDELTNYLKKIVALRILLKTPKSETIHCLKSLICNDIPAILPSEIIALDQQQTEYFKNMPVSQFIEQERVFLSQNVFQMSLKNGEDLWYYNKYIELATKIKFLLIQDDSKIGFENFKRYESNKDQLINKKNKGRVIESVFAKYYAESYVQAIEIRIAPPNSYNERIQMIIQANDKAYEAYIKKSGVTTRKKIKIGIIVHFIKQKKSVDEMTKTTMWQQIYDKNQKDTEKLLAFIESGSKYKQYLIGIDTANYEHTIRPYIFATVYQQVKAYATSHKQKIGFTYHAGEAFITPTSGLRAIDEAIYFLNYHNGDRIGHALALGIDVYKFAKSKKNKFIQNRGEYLDDVAWMYERLSREHNAEYTAQLHYLAEKYDKYVISCEGEKPTLKQYRLAWYLRGDNIQANVQMQYQDLDFQYEYKCAQSDAQVQKIHRHYQLATEYLKARQERIFESYDDMYLACVESVQKLVKRDISRKEIIIETNPTSNYKISEISKYNELPLFEFLKGEDPLTICINTDDSGIFDTNLQNEYYLVYAVAYEKYRNHEVAYELLSYLRKMGKVASFVSK